mmetsp:Transcript_27346/g.60538  ORF Transcript_27346/g.60538 Transcript_27346/m.60538 type:complete len:240 (-) Transcript_27346:296-1015(-)
MGRSAARNLRPSWRNARRLRLPRLPGRPPCLLLRARGPRAVPGLAQPRGHGHHRGRSKPPGGGLLRPSNGRHPLDRAGILGAGQEAGAAQALPVSQLDHLVLQVHARTGPLLQRKLRPRLQPPQAARQGDPGSAGQPAGDRAAGGQGESLRGPEGHHRPSRHHHRRLPGAERLHGLRLHLPPGQVHRHAQVRCDPVRGESEGYRGQPCGEAHHLVLHQDHARAPDPEGGGLQVRGPQDA